MAHALFPPELNSLQLAVLDEFLAGEEELHAAIMIAQENANLIEMALEEQERHQVPTRIKGYVEQVVPFYSNQEFKAHFRVEKITYEVRHIGKFAVSPNISS